MGSEISKKFRERLKRRDILLMPGAANALAARLIEDMGFEALYVSGAGVSNTYLGLPDIGFLSLTDIAQHVAMIGNVCNLPMMVDADTGFGNAVNVSHTIRVLEHAGASAIQLEDQFFPKRCGHFSGKAIIPSEEMVGKIKAAVDARRSQDTLIVARTDARAVEGIGAAVERCQRYVEAGADIIFLEAPESIEEMKGMVRSVNAPMLVNMVVGGKTPIIDTAELQTMGFAIVLYANAALQGAVYGMRQALTHLKQEGQLGEESFVATFSERQKLVRKDLFDTLEKRYT